MKKIIFFIMCLGVMTACKQKDKTEDKQPIKSEKPQENAMDNSGKSIADIVASAQHGDNFNQKEAVRFRIKVYKDDKEAFNARISFLTDMSKVKVEKKDGTNLVFAEDKSVLFPNSNDYERAESDLWTWANLLSLPYKLTQSGTFWDGKSQDSIADKLYDTAKIKFENRANRPQEDWFVIYVARKTGFLKAASFSEKKVQHQHYPEIIRYDNFISVKHVAIAKNWTFYQRKSATKFLGEQTGHAELSDFRFFSPPEDFFKAPKDALIINQKVEGDVVL